MASSSVPHFGILSLRTTRMVSRFKNVSPFTNCIVFCIATVHELFFAISVSHFPCSITITITVDCVVRSCSDLFEVLDCMHNEKWEALGTEIMACEDEKTQDFNTPLYLCLLKAREIFHDSSFLFPSISI